MKVILSRKGFDSRAGGVASPIFSDGTMLSLPIPEPDKSPIEYGQLNFAGVSVAEVAGDLTRHFRDANKRITEEKHAHLDPDLERDVYDRKPGWRPLFGQVGAAQSHLERQGVTKGDLFLFFGWFRLVERDVHTGHYRFLRNAPDIHVIYGWLQVGEIVKLNREPSRAPEWAKYHPHFHGKREDNNTIYVGTKTLEIPGVYHSIPGGGTFKKLRRALILTDTDNEDVKRSIWRLPVWCRPRGGQSPLTYHAKRSRWREERDCTRLESAARGQEFVIDSDYYPETLGWACGLISHAT